MGSGGGRRSIKALSGRLQEAVFPLGQTLPLGEVLKRRLEAYAVLVGVLVGVHTLYPHRPEFMVVVAPVSAALLVHTQHRWRLPQRLEPTEVKKAAVVTAAVAIVGVGIAVGSISEAAPRDFEIAHSALLFVGLALAFLGAGSLMSVLRRVAAERASIAWIGLGLLVVAGLVYFVALRNLSPDYALFELGAPGRWAWAAVGAVLISPVFVGVASEGAISWVNRPGRHTVPTRAAGTACAAAAVVVAAVLGWWLGHLPLWGLWWAATLVPAAFLLAVALRVGSWLPVAGAAVVVALAPWVLIERFGYPTQAAWALAVLMVVVFLIAVDNNTDVLFIVILAAVFWSTLPRSEPLDAGTLRTVPGEEAFVALGDSYMSGEGASAYFDGTNSRGRNECRRAPTAYPALLALTSHGREDPRIPGRAVFLACSGAVVANLVDTPQYEDDPLGGRTELQADGVWRPGRTQLQQLSDLLREHPPSTVSFALVSIGGNDAGFGTIAQTCIGPGDCTVLAARWRSQLVTRLPDELDRAYGAIAKAFPARVPVVVVPYPIPIAPTTCPSSTLTDAEHRFLYDFTRDLNNVIREAAARAGFLVADGVERSLLRRGQVLCGGEESGVNWIRLNPVEGSLAQTTDPRHWLHNSLHPNERGHKTIARTLEHFLASNTLVERRLPEAAGGTDARGGLGDDPPGDGKPLPQQCEELDGGACETAWTLRELSAAAPGPSVALLSLVLAHWYLSVRMIVWWRTRTGEAGGDRGV